MRYSERKLRMLYAAAVHNEAKRQFNDAVNVRTAFASVMDSKKGVRVFKARMKELIALTNWSPDQKTEKTTMIDKLVAAGARITHKKEK
jgi:hypothetical protein